MFGWRTPPERDAVSAAQRRLAAIAAQFATSEAQSPVDLSPGGERPGQPSPDEAADAAGSVPAESARPSEQGRHLTRSAVGQSGSARLSAHHIAIIALTVLAMVTVAAWWVLRSIPHSQPVQLSSERTLPSSMPPASGLSTAAGAPQAAGATPAPAPSGVAPASTATTAGPLVVDVAGKVRSPGIVELPAGSRVVDALDAAGGPKPGVDTRSLNLARLLVDGEQIVVGFDIPIIGVSPGVGTTSPPPTGASIAPVDLNTATAEQLDTLPGIGPVTAQAILTWRSENGAFTSVDELLEVSGIGDATLADIAAYVYV